MLNQLIPTCGIRKLSLPEMTRGTTKSTASDLSSFSINRSSVPSSLSISSVVTDVSQLHTSIVNSFSGNSP